MAHAEASYETYVLRLRNFSILCSLPKDLKKFISFLFFCTLLPMPCWLFLCPSRYQPLDMASRYATEVFRIYNSLSGIPCWLNSSPCRCQVFRTPLRAKTVSNQFVRWQKTMLSTLLATWSSMLSAGNSTELHVYCKGFQDMFAFKKNLFSFNNSFITLPIVRTSKKIISLCRSYHHVIYI